MFSLVSSVIIHLCFVAARFALTGFNIKLTDRDSYKEQPPFYPWKMGCKDRNKYLNNQGIRTVHPEIFCHGMTSRLIEK